MRRIKHTLALSFALSTMGCYPQKFPSDPVNGAIVTRDIGNFWMAFDQLMSDSAQNPFDDYLKTGTPGLRDFIPDRIVNAHELKKMVLSEKDYYSRIRSSTLEVKQYEMQIRATYYALEYLYPEAVFPPVHYVMGRTTSGGSASPNGIIIGLECFSDTPFKTAYGRPSLNSAYLPFVVAHEVIHFLQKDDPKDSTLLKECIREGAADFIGGLIAGENVKKLNGDNVYVYGDSHERQLWSEFSKDLFKKEYGNWLYNQTRNEYPQNLGYWMGYKIVEAYYNSFKDKKKAVRNILHTSDYRQFFTDSGYAKKFAP